MSVLGCHFFELCVLMWSTGPAACSLDHLTSQECVLIGFTLPAYHSLTHSLVSRCGSGLEWAISPDPQQRFKSVDARRRECAFYGGTSVVQVWDQLFSLREYKWTLLGLGFCSHLRIIVNSWFHMYFWGTCLIFVAPNSSFIIFSSDCSQLC